MKKIIGIIHPFDLYQTFYVYEDGNKLDAMQIKIKDIPNTIFQLCETYNVYQLDLSGAERFSKKIIQDIQKQELIKYNKNILTIRCI